jgi:alkylhydroperoxidase family enzyme
MGGLAEFATAFPDGRTRIPTGGSPPLRRVERMMPETDDILQSKDTTAGAQVARPIRPELAAAHSAILERWATPGSFWTAAQRIALVEQVRRARDSAPLPAWVAPSTVNGLLDGAADLPAVAVDAVWRLTNHPGTLTIDWYRQLLARGLAAGPYVELVAVVAQANCIDRFTDALGVNRHTLPPPGAGGPNPAVAADCEVRNHWVPTAPIKGPNVIKALSLLPFENESRRILSDAQYVPGSALLGDLRLGCGALSRPQVELLAARTSTLNECFY